MTEQIEPKGQTGIIRLNSLLGIVSLNLHQLLNSSDCTVSTLCESEHLGVNVIFIVHSIVPFLNESLKLSGGSNKKVFFSDCLHTNVCVCVCVG